MPDTNTPAKRHPPEAEMISYCSGGLSEKDAKRLEKHLFQCPECSQWMVRIVVETSKPATRRFLKAGLGQVKQSSDS